MSKSKRKTYRFEDYEYQDGGIGVEFHKMKHQLIKNKVKKKRIEHAIRTKNIDELMEYEDDIE